jgi:hypothetical protein
MQGHSKTWKDSELVSRNSEEAVKHYSKYSYIPTINYYGPDAYLMTRGLPCRDDRTATAVGHESNSFSSLRAMGPPLLGDGKGQYRVHLVGNSGRRPLLLKVWWFIPRRE